MSVAAYESYRESGIAWLGQLPGHWAVEKFRHRFRESPEKIDAEVIGPMLSVSGYRGIEVKDYDDENRRRLDEELVGYRIVRPGQLVVNTMWLNYAGLGVSEHEGHVSPAYRSYWVRPGLDGRYAHHLMRSSVYVQGYTRLLTGIRPNSLQMSRDDLMEFPVIIPPLSEQAAIAAFLDREIGKIDALVEAQRRLIELLKEKRHTVISHAVTKGLDPTAPMKDSGVEWLGEVPAHWEMRPLKHLGTFNAGAGFPDVEQGFQNEEIAFHKVNALALADAEGFLARGENSVSRDTAKRLGAHIFPARSIVFAKIGAALLLGRLRLLGEPACLDNNLMGLTVNGDHDVDFVRSAMSLVKFDLISNPGTVPSLNKGQIANAPIPVPPYLEQRAISVWLRAAELRLDTLAAAAHSTIALLQERRSALISAAVTGKIDVRGFVPEQAETA